MADVPGVASRIPIKVVSGYIEDGVWEPQYGGHPATPGILPPFSLDPGVPDPTGTCLMIASGLFDAVVGTTNYPVGTLIANSATNTAVVPMRLLPAARAGGLGGCIRRTRLKTLETGAINTVIRMHFYITSPTVVNGDHNAWSSSYSDYIGSVDVPMDKQFSDGTVWGVGAPPVGNELNYYTSMTNDMFCLLETRTLFTPLGGKQWMGFAELYLN